MSDDTDSSSESTTPLPRTRERQEELTTVSALFGRKWNPVIIHALAEGGPLGFSELTDPIDDISNKALSESLNVLEEMDAVERTVINKRPFRVKYSLTEWGETLGRIVTDFLDEMEDDSDPVSAPDEEDGDSGSTDLVEGEDVNPGPGD